MAFQTDAFQVDAFQVGPLTYKDIRDVNIVLANKDIIVVGRDTNVREYVRE
jgi:hypothetical protein